MWLTATYGVGVVFHPSPLDAQIIGELDAEIPRHFHDHHADVPVSLHAPRSTEDGQSALRAGGGKTSERVPAFEDQFVCGP